MRKILILLLGIILISNITMAESTNINGAGATFAYPPYATWAYLFDAETGKEINYQSIGSSGGVRAITNNEVSFAGTDAPMTPEELAENNLIQFPTLTGAVVIIANLEGESANRLVLNGNVIARIFSGEITHWRHEDIATLNPNLGLPDANIVVIHRSDGSGTTFAFSSYLSSVSSSWKANLGSDKVIAWQVGIGAKGNEGVSAQGERIFWPLRKLKYRVVKVIA
mgnify:CR=1 FL=1